MNEKASCITINCGCCGNGNSGATPNGVLKYAQLEATDQTIVQNQKIYFNDKSFGNLEMTQTGSVIVPPGIYRFCMNFTYANGNKQSCFASIRFYDLTNQTYFDKPCARGSFNFVGANCTSETSFLMEIKEEMEVCLIGNYTSSGNPAATYIYANIVEIPVATGTV